MESDKIPQITFLVTRFVPLNVGHYFPYNQSRDLQKVATRDAEHL